MVWKGDNLIIGGCWNSFNSWGFCKIMILLSSDIFKKSYVRGVISYISTEIVDGILVGGCLYKV